MNTGSPSPENFCTTRWTLVLRSRGDAVESRAALGELCEAYWTPVFRFLRREGRDDDESRELTQEFFARLLAGGSLEKADPEKGRFRSYLLGALKHFLTDRRRSENREKRGGGAVIESIESVGTDPYIVALEVPPGTGPYTLEITMKSNSNGEGQVFWTTADEKPFHRDRSVSFEPKHDKRTHTYRIKLPVGKPLTGLRLDPATATGEITLQTFRLLDKDGKELKSWTKPTK